MLLHFCVKSWKPFTWSLFQPFMKYIVCLEGNSKSSKKKISVPKIGSCTLGTVTFTATQTIRLVSYVCKL